MWFIRELQELFGTCENSIKLLHFQELKKFEHLILELES